MNDTIPVTAQLVEQRLEHRATEAAAAVSRQSDRYQALCWQRFIAAALAAPLGQPCPDCAAGPGVPLSKVTREQAAQAIMNYFLANAEAGNHAANDETDRGAGPPAQDFG